MVMGNHWVSSFDLASTHQEHPSNQNTNPSNALATSNNTLALKIPIVPHIIPQKRQNGHVIYF